MIRLAIPLLVLGAIALSACGRAPVTSAPEDPAFAARDTDGDGRLSFAESGLDAETFARLDADGDTRLTRLEWQGAMADPTLPGRLQAQNEATRPIRPTGPGTW